MNPYNINLNMAVKKNDIQLMKTNDARCIAISFDKGSRSVNVFYPCSEDDIQIDEREEVETTCINRYGPKKQNPPCIH